MILYCITILMNEVYSQSPEISNFQDPETLENLNDLRGTIEQNQNIDSVKDWDPRINIAKEYLGDDFSRLTPEVQKEFVEAVDKRLNKLFVEAKYLGDELQVNPFTKLWIKKWLTELHLINETTKTDITLFYKKEEKSENTNNDGEISSALYDFLDGNEDALLRYLHRRWNELWNFITTPSPEPMNFSVEKGEKGIDTAPVRDAIWYLQNLTEALRQIEWDSRFGGDKKLVGIKKLLDRAMLGCTGKKLSEQKVNDFIEELYDKFKDFINEEEAWAQYGEYENGSIFNCPKENFEKLFTTQDSVKQKEIIRSFFGTKAKFLSTYIEWNGFKVEEEDANKIIDEIESHFKLTEADFDKQGNLINSEKKKNIDMLYAAENPTDLGNKLNSLGIKIPTFNHEDLSFRMDILKKLFDNIKRIKQQLNTLPTEEQLEQNYRDYAELLSKKSPLTKQEYCILSNLNEILQDKKALHSLYEVTKQHLEIQLRYGSVISFMRSGFYPTFAEYGGGAKWPNGDIYNDIIWYWAFDIADENYDLTEEIIKEIMFTVVAGVLTAWIGIGISSWAAALAISTNYARLSMTARNIYKGISIANRSKIGAFWLKCVWYMGEGTVFNFNTQLLYAIFNGEDLDEVNINPLAVENLRTATFIGVLKNLYRIKPVNGRYFNPEGKSYPILTNVWNTTIDLWVDITSMIMAEEFNNIVRGKKVEVEGKIITERGFSTIEGTEFAQIIGLILMNKFVYGWIFQKALKEHAFKIDKIDGRYCSIIDDNPLDPTIKQRILDEVPEHLKHKIYEYEWKLFYEEKNGDFIQIRQYSDFIKFLEVEQKISWSDNTVSTTDSQADHINIQMSNSREMPQRSGNPLEDPTKKLSQNQNNHNGEKIKGETSDMSFEQPEQSSNTPGKWEKTWIEENNNTREELNNSIDDVIGTIDEMLWDEILAKQNFWDHYSEIFKNLTQYKKELKQLQDKFNKEGLTNDELNRFREIKKAVDDFENNFLGIDDLIEDDYDTQDRENFKDKDWETQEAWEDKISDEDFFKLLMDKAYPEGWLEQQPWLERTLKTIEQLKQSIDDVIATIDEMLWDEILAKQNFWDYYSGIFKNFPEYKEELVKLKNELNTRGLNIQDEELIDIYDKIREVSEDVDDFENYLLDMDRENLDMSEDDMDALREDALNDPEHDRRKAILKDEERKMRERKEKRDNISDPIDRKIFDRETEHEDYWFQEKHEYGTTKEENIKTIKEILCKEYDFWDEDFEYLDNLKEKESKLNLLMTILDHPFVANKFFDKLGRWSDTFSENFERFSHASILGPLEEMLGLTNTTKMLFLSCFEADCFPFLKNADNFNVYNLARDVHLACLHQENADVTDIIKKIKSDIKNGKYNWE